jgi:hypothetical protein
VFYREWFPVDAIGQEDLLERGDVGSNTTLHCKRKDFNRCSPTRIPVQTEIDIAEWEE